jgi:hypothetical protein
LISHLQSPSSGVVAVEIIVARGAVHLRCGVPGQRR